MSDDSLQRTLRRCTAVLVLPLAALLLAYTRSLMYRGIADRTTPVLRPLAVLLAVGAVSYLLGSLMLALVQSEREDAAADDGA
ncbi:hypothetical protein [Halarchaeum sp. P4]|uniref:hypothetical protein n=1 Tax=Halarchaeum sp. P4 TaxID=3421639 RepID=UPI003EBC1340